MWSLSAIAPSRREGKCVRWFPCRPTPANMRRSSIAYCTMLDSRGYDWIAVDAPPDAPEWEAVRDRLRAATSGR